MSEPAVRGRYMETFLQHVARLPVGDVVKVRTEIGAARLEAMARAKSFFSWLPVSYNLIATRAVSDVIGSRRTHEFFVALQYDTLDNPLFTWVRALVPGLRNNPGSGLRWVAKGYAIMFRDAGTWQVVDVRETSATLEMVDVPAEMTGDHVWLASVGSSLHALFMLAKVHGAVTPVLSDPARPQFRFRWTKE